VFRGRGVEFDEVREYVAGDDVRLIDWNVTARTGDPYIKKHVEDRQQTVLVAVDVSASVAYGGRQTKRELESEIACVLARAAARAGDLTALLLFSDSVELYIPPARGNRHALRIARTVLGHEPRGTRTDIGGALGFCSQALRRRTLVFLISDFHADGFERPLRVASRRHDCIALTVRDPRERALPRAGLALVEDAETREQILVDLSDADTRRRIDERIAIEEADRVRLFARCGVDHASLFVDEPYDRALYRLLSRRVRHV